MCRYVLRHFQSFLCNICFSKIGQYIIHDFLINGSTSYLYNTLYHRIYTHVFIHTYMFSFSFYLVKSFFFSTFYTLYKVDSLYLTRPFLFYFIFFFFVMKVSNMVTPNSDVVVSEKRANVAKLKRPRNPMGLPRENSDSTLYPFLSFVVG